MDQVSILNRRLEKKDNRNKELSSELSRMKEKLTARIDKIRRLDEYYTEECRRLVLEHNEAVDEVNFLREKVVKLENRVKELEDSTRRCREDLKESKERAEGFRNTLGSLRKDNLELGKSLDVTNRRWEKSAERTKTLTHRLRMSEKRVLLYRSRYEEIRKQYIRDVGKEPEESTDGKRSEEQEA